MPNEEEGTEAIPAGSVNKDGDVVDNDGQVIGRVNGDKASQLAGSMVDQEGDVLDDEGNIIGHADTVAESMKEVDPKPVEEGAEGVEGSQKPLEEGAEGAEKPDLEDDAEGIKKPELTGPFGVQDKGEITNATGQVIGHLQGRLKEETSFNPNTNSSNRGYTTRPCWHLD